MSHLNNITVKSYRNLVTTVATIISYRPELTIGNDPSLPNPVSDSFLIGGLAGRFNKARFIFKNVVANTAASMSLTPYLNTNTALGYIPKTVLSGTTNTNLVMTASLAAGNNPLIAFPYFEVDGAENVGFNLASNLSDITAGEIWIQAIYDPAN